MNSLELRPNLTEDVDYVLVPKPAWDLLIQWYSLTPNQEPIVRKVGFDFNRITFFLSNILFIRWLIMEYCPAICGLKST